MACTANLNCTTLMDQFSQTPIPPFAWIQVDGASDNQCKTTIAYLEWVVSICPHILVLICARLPPGHTHGGSSCDRMFGKMSNVVWQRKHARERSDCIDIFTPTDFKERMLQMLRSTEETAHLRLDWVNLLNTYDVAKWLDDHKCTKKRQTGVGSGGPIRVWKIWREVHGGE